MNFFKKNWYLAIPAALLLSPLIIVICISISYGYTFPESIAVMKAFGKARTKFQQVQFTEDKFRRIQPGMMGRDAFELVGVPLERHDGDTRWFYSVPLSGAEYWHERTLILDKGKVTHVVCRFHSPESK
jgi:hypothetical protein